VLPFATYARASGGATDVRQLATAGVGFRGIFGRREGVAGVALAWGQPEERSLRNQYVAELFYRIQLAQYIQLTADLQLIAEPSRNRHNETIGVLGLRMRIIL
jgi:porin